MRFIFALFLLSAFLLPVSAHAQCTMPNGQPAAAMGVIVFNTDHKVMQYCNGDDWVGLRGGKGGGTDLPDCNDSEITQWSGGAWMCNNGSGLDNLNASNLTSGTIPNARFPATLPAVSGANLTNLNASNLTAGTVPVARLGASGTRNNTTFLRGDGTWAAEADPKVGATTNNQWCRGSGSQIVCDQTAPSGGGLGVGQTWQNVSGSRAAGTSYRNTTGQPIMLAVSSGASGSIIYQLSSDNITWVISKNINQDADDRDINFEIIVPNNWYYRVVGTLEGPVWLELR